MRPATRPVPSFIPSRALRLLVCCLLLPAASAIAAPSLQIVRFDDVKPDQARITTCWDALGIDQEQRVYIAFSDQSAHHP